MYNHGKKTNNKKVFPLGPAEIIPYRLAFKFISDPLTTLNKISRKYGDISHFKFGPKTHVYLVNDPYLIEDILVRSNRCFIKSPGLKLARHVIGNGLLINEGENHTVQRKIIQPAFSRDNIKTYGNIISELSIRYINTNWNDGETVNIHKEMTKLTLNIISELLFGSNKITKKETKEISDLITTIIEYLNKLRISILRLVEKVPLPMTIKYKKAVRQLDNIIYSKIDQYQISMIRPIIMRTKGDTNSLKQSKYQKEDPETILSILIKHVVEDDLFLKNLTTERTPKANTELRMTKKQLRDEIMTIFLAGHETIANALTWTIHLITEHPQEESKIIDEITTTLGDKVKDKNSFKVISFEDVNRLKYVEKVLMESMRLYPPSWVLGRQAVTKYTLAEKYDIPLGAVVIMSQYLMHRDPRYFPEPERFNPERWTFKFKKSIPRFCYFPFGGGPRSCLGESLAWTEGIILLANIVSNWKITNVHNKATVELQPLITLRPKKGLLVRINKRIK